MKLPVGKLSFVKRAGRWRVTLMMTAREKRYEVWRWMELAQDRVQ